MLVSAEQRQRDRFGVERAAADGLVRLHGTHRGVLLVEFLDWSWGCGGAAGLSCPGSQPLGSRVLQRRLLRGMRSISGIGSSGPVAAGLTFSGLAPWGWSRWC